MNQNTTTTATATATAATAATAALEAALAACIAADRARNAASDRYADAIGVNCEAQRMGADGTYTPIQVARAARAFEAAQTDYFEAVAKSEAARHSLREAAKRAQ